jgi:DnaJ-class molecular chaperone
VRASSIAWRTAAPGNPRWADGLGRPMLDEREYECPFCRGRGELAGGGTCPVCIGHGKVQVDPPAVKCAFCNGRGQVPPRSNLTCWVCKGRGFVSVVPPVQTCPDCLGRGKKPGASLYCTRCHGAGVVLAPGGS